MIAIKIRPRLRTTFGAALTVGHIGEGAHVKSNFVRVYLEACLLLAGVLIHPDFRMQITDHDDSRAFFQQTSCRFRFLAEPGDIHPETAAIHELAPVILGPVGLPHGKTDPVQRFAVTVLSNPAARVITKIAIEGNFCTHVLLLLLVALENR